MQIHTIKEKQTFETPWIQPPFPPPGVHYGMFVNIKYFSPQKLFALPSDLCFSAEASNKRKKERMMLNKGNREKLFIWYNNNNNDDDRDTQTTMAWNGNLCVAYETCCVGWRGKGTFIFTFQHISCTVGRTKDESTAHKCSPPIGISIYRKNNS